MEQTKRCPYCAEEILFAAVKCKHCQSALALSVRAVETSRTRELKLPPHPEAIAIRAASNAPLQGTTATQPSIGVHFNARHAATQVERAAFNSKMVGVLSFEVLVSALAAGLYRQSLATGLVVAVGLFCMFNREDTKNFLGFVFSLAWGLAAVGIVYAMDPSEPVAWILAGFIGAAISLGAHMAAFQWQRDFA